MMLVVCVLCVLMLSAVEGNNPTCVGQFPCFDGSCIDKDKWCDSQLDCNDSVDEIYCWISTSFRPDPNNCSEDFFKCKDGPCIPLVGRCDGHYACGDHSDEVGCGVTTTEFDWQNTTSRSTTLPTSPYSSSLGSEEITSRLSIATDPDLGLGSVSSTSRPVSVLSSSTDLQRDFVELDASQFQNAKVSAHLWLLRIRNQNGGWNEETARAFTAVHLSEDNLLLNAYEKSFMMKELHLKILAALLRNESTPISLEDLSLYLNALTSSCASTRDFYGRDLVHDLRERSDFLHRSSNSSNPLIYLSLCLNNATRSEDIVKIKEIVHNELKEDRFGVLALASLAATCISRTPKFSTYNIGYQVARHLYETVTKQGLPNNVYELALVTQALNEARVNQDLWNRTEAVKRIIKEQDSDGSFGNILSTYLAIPVLSGRSLLSARRCSAEISKGFAALDVQNAEDITIKYTLFFGHPVASSISLFVPVKKTSSFFDIMLKAASMNPSYEFRYNLRGKNTIVYSIGAVTNDPEHGMYWNLYITDSQHSSSEQSFRKYEDDIKAFYPADGEEVVYWWKSIY